MYIYAKTFNKVADVKQKSVGDYTKRTSEWITCGLVIVVAGISFQRLLFVCFLKETCHLLSGGSQRNAISAKLRQLSPSCAFSVVYLFIDHWNEWNEMGLPKTTKDRLYVVWKENKVVATIPLFDTAEPPSPDETRPQGATSWFFVFFFSLWRLEATRKKQLQRDTTEREKTKIT